MDNKFISSYLVVILSNPDLQMTLILQASFTELQAYYPTPNANDSKVKYELYLRN